MKLPLIIREAHSKRYHVEGSSRVHYAWSLALEELAASVGKTYRALTGSQTITIRPPTPIERKKRKRV